MTRAEQIEALFPITVTISQSMIDKAEIWNEQNCVGALALKKGLRASKLLKRSDIINWSFYQGRLFIKQDKVSNYDMILIRTKEDVNLTEISSPITVTFNNK